MEVVEMLDNLKEKARWLLSVRSAGNLGFRFMRWI